MNSQMDPYIAVEDNLVLFNVEIFVQLNELDELDRITYAWIALNYSLTTSTENIQV